MKSKMKSAVLLVMLAATAVPPAFAQDIDAVTRVLAKRYYLARADARCHRLDGASATALKAGFLQARNEAIRNGRDMTALAPYLAAAGEAADRTDCADPRLDADMESVRGSLRAYVAQTHLDLAGGQSGWTGDRSFADRNTWRLVQYQSNPGGDAAIGLYGPLTDTRFVVMVHFQDGEAPYAARLLVRDPAVAAQGVIDAAPRAVTAAAPMGFTAAGTLGFMAENVSPARVRLKPAVATNGFGFSASGAYVGDQPPVDAVRFDFPTRAYLAIARLDPREDMVVACDFNDGTRYLRFEVGDFITGLGYVNLPSAYGGA